jgi:hypothetical protein
MSHMKDGMSLAEEQISHLIDTLDARITNLNRTETIHPRTRLMATRHLVPLLELMRVERKKLQAMNKQWVELP